MNRWKIAVVVLLIGFTVIAVLTWPRSPEPVATPTPTATPTATAEPTATPAPAPTATATVTATQAPTPKATPTTAVEFQCWDWRIHLVEMDIPAGEGLINETPVPKGGTMNVAMNERVLVRTRGLSILISDMNVYIAGEPGTVFADCFSDRRSVIIGVLTTDGSGPLVALHEIDDQVVVNWEW